MEFLKGQCRCGHIPGYHQNDLGKCFAPETPPCPCRQFEPRLGENTIKVCAIDPSWVTGMVTMEFNRRPDIAWFEGANQVANARIIRCFVSDVSKHKTCSTQEKISIIVSDMADFISTDNTDVFAIELPFQGTSKIAGVPDYNRSFRSSASINQGRLFQALVDLAVSLGRYNPAHSEIHNSQAKAAVIRAIGVKKEAIRKTVERVYHLELQGKVTKPHKEAITDAISVALGYIHLAHPEIPIPTVIFKKQS